MRPHCAQSRRYLRDLLGASSHCWTVRRSPRYPFTCWASFEGTSMVCWKLGRITEGRSSDWIQAVNSGPENVFVPWKV